jgi:hypothetical protein
VIDSDWLIVKQMRIGGPRQYNSSRPGGLEGCDLGEPEATKDEEYPGKSKNQPSRLILN